MQVSIGRGHSVGLPNQIQGPIKYKVLNKETGRKVSVTRWRVQIRKGGENLSKLFDDEAVARSWEEQELHRINTGVPQNLIFDQKYQLEMPDMRRLLKDYFEQYMSKLPLPH